jgi:enoyl-CoA hydratase
MNAINGQLMDDFSAALDSIEVDDRVRSLIVTGGDKVFAAGADIKEISRLDTPTASHAFLVKIQKIFTRLQSLEMPVIAAISGLALGGGCELALACDCRIATEAAQLGLPEINLGLMPGAGGTQRLPRLIGSARAMEMLFSGRPISATTAYAFGLVNRVVSPDRMMIEARELAELLSRKPRWALKWIKSAVRVGMEMDLSSALEYETRCFELLFSTADQKAGVQAFINKQKP